jgi:hypothetical protein
MTNSATHTADARPTLGDGRTRPLSGEGEDVADLIRHSCLGSRDLGSRGLGQDPGRHGFRVAAAGVKGRLFFEGGRVVHAEFGEDFGLRAIVGMLRADAKVAGVWTGTWPQQSSVHFGPEVLALVADPEAVDETPRVDTRVVRRVRARSEAASLPEPVVARPVISSQPQRADDLKGIVNGEVGDVQRSTPASSVWIRGASPTQPLSNRVAETLAQRLRPARSDESVRAGHAGSVVARPARSEVSPAAVVARPVRSEPPAEAATEAPARRSESARPSLVRRTVAVRASASAVAAARSARTRTEVKPPSVAASQELEDQLTTMVRVSARGAILAARGKHAEQLADAAAYIHGLANLIASDLGRHGRAVVHIQGGSNSLLVLRSEVNDIAAALGPTRRLSSLLKKAGV